MNERERERESVCGGGDRKKANPVKEVCCGFLNEITYIHPTYAGQYGSSTLTATLPALATRPESANFMCSLQKQTGPKGGVGG